MRPGRPGNQRPRRPCGKVRYRDEIAAKLALSRLLYQDKPGHTERRAYRCKGPKGCGGWHLTSAELRTKASQA